MLLSCQNVERWLSQSMHIQVSLVFTFFDLIHLCRHHHNGRWEARIGRVFGNKYLYLGTFGNSHFLLFSISFIISNITTLSCIKQKENQVEFKINGFFNVQLEIQRIFGNKKTKKNKKFGLPEELDKESFSFTCGLTLVHVLYLNPVTSLKCHVERCDSSHVIGVPQLLTPKKKVLQFKIKKNKAYAPR